MAGTSPCMALQALVLAASLGCASGGALGRGHPARMSAFVSHAPVLALFSPSTEQHPAPMAGTGAPALGSWAPFGEGGAVRLGGGVMLAKPAKARGGARGGRGGRGGGGARGRGKGGSRAEQGEEEDLEEISTYVSCPKCFSDT